MHANSSLLLSVHPSIQNRRIVMRITAPAFEAIEYYETNFPRDFGEPSPYRGTPSIEKDNIWQDLWDCKFPTNQLFHSVNVQVDGAINVPKEKQAELNHTTPREGTTWRYTDEKFGGGPAALIWGFHQIHCIDVLRMASYRDHYQKRHDEFGEDMPFVFEGPEYLVRIHIGKQPIFLVENYQH